MRKWLRRIAAVTNFRDGYAPKSSPRSRGELVSNYLRSSQAPADYANRIKRDGHNYNGFNLLLGDVDELFYVSNRNGGVTAVAPGVHGLSNSLLNTPWPKVTQGCEAMSKLMTTKTQDLIDGLFTIGRSVPTPEESRGTFAALRSVSADVRHAAEAAGFTIGPLLSMGMSGDYEVAIEEGATQVRLGSAIFGGRG